MLDFQPNDEQAVAHVRLHGSIAENEYSQFLPRLEAFIERHGRIRVLLDLRGFDGWEDVSAFWQHVLLVKDHHRAVRRIAIVGERTWERVIAELVPRLAGVEGRYFDAASLDDAEIWAAEPLPGNE